MDSAKGYTAQGTASWYGNKFHGHKTSNGETYDMYAFSAAHKSLPLPTYVKVTNLDNNRSIIVRVNDRGPFHGDRIIDLSYAAAARLDYHKKGLARVKIEAITPSQGQSYQAPKAVVISSPVASEVTPNKASVESHSSQASTPDLMVFSHLQVGAFRVEQSANQLKTRLFESFDTQVKVSTNHQNDGLYKVLLGPFDNDTELLRWQQKLQQEGFGNAVRVALVP